jgi:hypothetical protein
MDFSLFLVDLIKNLLYGLEKEDILVNYVKLINGYGQLRFNLNKILLLLVVMEEIYKCIK